MEYPHPQQVRVQKKKLIRLTTELTDNIDESGTRTHADFSTAIVHSSKDA